MKLIDKDAVVAEIERRLHFDRSWIDGDERRQKRMTSISPEYYKRVGSKHAGEAFLDFVNTLEVKEVDLPTWEPICSFQYFSDNDIFIEDNCLRWGNMVISLDELKKLPKKS